MVRPLLVATSDSHDDSDIHEALLSQVDSGDTDTPTSDAFGFLEDSPTRSFLHTSFFADSHQPENIQNSHWPASILRKCRKIIIVAVVAIVWPWGAYSYHQLPALLTSQAHAVPNSPSSMAQQAFAAYNHSSDENKVIFLFQSYPTRFHNDTQASILEFKSELIQFDKTLQTWFQNNSSQHFSFSRYTSYWTLQQQGLHWLAKALLSRDETRLVAQFEYEMVTSNDTRHDNKTPEHVLSEIKHLVHDFSSSNVSLQITSLSLLQEDLRASTRNELRLEDCVVVPLAMILMGMVLPQARPLYLWIVPLMTLVTTVATWAIVLRYLAMHTPITTTTPTIMMSLSLGMGMDYTLFLLSRYLPEKSVDQMLQHTSRVLLLSGITLMTTFLCFLSLPLLVLRSLGLGAFISIASALVVNLTLVPCLLSTQLGEKIYSERRAAAMSNATFRGVSGSFWFRLAKWLLEPHRAVIALLLVMHLLVPVAQFAFQMKTSLNLDLAVPKTSPALQVYHKLAEVFGRGQMHPYRLLFDGRSSNTSMTSAYAFDIQHMVIDELIAIDHEDSMGMTHLGDLEHQDWYSGDAHWLPYEDVSCADDLIQKVKPTATVFNGISVLRNARVPYAVYYASKLCGNFKPHCPVEILNLVHAMDMLATTSDESMTFVTATLGVSPFEYAGMEWLEEARKTIHRMKDAGVLGGVDVHILGNAGVEFDAMKAVQKAFPMMASVTVGVVVLLIGLFFKSVLAPLRSIASIATTLSFTYGLSVLVFQKGLLSWTNVDALIPSSHDANFCWLVPVMSFSIIVGLALDYDVFLMSSILEHRENGYEPKSSVAAGLSASGGIITAAGLIMAFAFGSLMLSSNPLLYQWAFLVTVAVLFDTFVVRPIVAPSLISLSGTLAWWPRSLPMESVCFQDFRSESNTHIVALDTLEEHVSEYEPITLHRRENSGV